jgi:hypothetical protein
MTKLVRIREKWSGLSQSSRDYGASEKYFFVTLIKTGTYGKVRFSDGVEIMP